VECEGPEVYQPRLTLWGHLWRTVACALVSALIWADTFSVQWHDNRPAWFLDLGAGLAAYGLVLFRRRWPLPVALVTGALTLVSAVAVGPALLAAVSIAARRQLWPIAATAVVGIIAGQGYTDLQPGRHPDPFWVSMTFNVVATAAILGWGMYIGSRRELVWSLRRRAEQAESEQEHRVAQAQTNERARIAREMHDVLAHRISQISVHAGAIAYREDLEAGQMRESVRVIQEKAHEALTDLRDVLGVLRDTELLAGTDRPQPVYADVAALVDEARASGQHVEFADGLGPAAPGDVAGRTVYRIVQEGLTNANKHAPGAVVRVEVTGGPAAGIDVHVRNPLGFGPTRTPGAGLGLVGLAERAHLRGGRLEHRQEGGQFLLHAWIPWPA
jgi:signal transduction histidine kinase